MTFARTLDRWILATALLSTIMFFLASEAVAVGLVACLLIVLGFSMHSDRPDRADRPKADGARSASSRRVLVLLLNSLTLGVLGWAILRVSGDRELLVESVGDLLAWSLVIRVFDPRPNNRRGLLLLMSVFGAISSILTSNVLLVGVLAAAYIPVAGWTILLHQFARGHAVATGERAGAPALVVPREALRQLRRLGVRLLPVFLVVSAIVYIIMPRGVGADMLGDWDTRADGATTGFTDRVLLQRGGVLASSDETVMDVVATDSDGRNIGGLDRPVLLRGAVLDAYDPVTHAWTRGEGAGPQTIVRASSIGQNEISRSVGEGLLFTYRITMRNKDTEYLFTPMRPVYVLVDRDTEMRIGGWDLVVRTEGRSGRFSYTVQTTPEYVPQRFAGEALGPIEVSERVRELAQELMEDADLSRAPDAELTEFDGQIARVFETYFRRRGVYDTEMIPSPTGVDPIEHFVQERMRGHCEQFASAMAAMLRSIGVSARVVTGYRATEYNDLAGHYTVRQRDAHAWVEVRTAPGVWASYDPSPSVDGAFGAGQRTGLLHRLRQAYEAIEYYWVVYVVSFDEQMKRSLLAKLGLADEPGSPGQSWQGGRRLDPSTLLRRAFRAVGAGLVAFAATAAALFAIATAWRLLAGRLRLPAALLRLRLAALRGRKRYGEAALERRYAAAVSALSRAGFERPRWLGALDHAGRLRAVDAALSESMAGLSALYYEAKFGGREIGDADIARADRLVREVRERASRARREAVDA